MERNLDHIDHLLRWVAQMCSSANVTACRHVWCQEFVGSKHRSALEDSDNKILITSGWLNHSFQEMIYLRYIMIIKL